MATLTLASSSESNPSFQTFHWKIISLQFNAICATILVWRTTRPR